MQIETVMQQLENTSYVTSPLYSESWLRSFVSYVERNNDYLNLTLDNEEDFIDALKEVSIEKYEQCEVRNVTKVKLNTKS